jgi:hypothetical protein
LGEVRNAHKILFCEYEGKRPLERPRHHRWDYNIKIGIKELDVRMWTGFIWLRIGSSGGLL